MSAARCSLSVFLAGLVGGICSGEPAPGAAADSGGAGFQSRLERLEAEASARVGALCRTGAEPYLQELRKFEARYAKDADLKWKLDLVRKEIARVQEEGSHPFPWQRAAGSSGSGSGDEDSGATESPGGDAEAEAGARPPETRPAVPPGTLVLSGREGELKGGLRYDTASSSIAGWEKKGASVAWSLGQVPEGQYVIYLVYAGAEDSDGIELEGGGRTRALDLPATGGEARFRTVRVGSTQGDGGPTKLVLRQKAARASSLRVRSAALVPTSPPPEAAAPAEDPPAE